MGRLLDMEEIIRLAKTTYPTDDVKKITWLLCHTPTAYNVDKVVEELEKAEHRLLENASGFGCTIGIINAMKRAIEIVRKGGVE